MSTRRLSRWIAPSVRANLVFGSDNDQPTLERSILSLKPADRPAKTTASKGIKRKKSSATMMADVT